MGEKLVVCLIVLLLNTTACGDYLGRPVCSGNTRKICAASDSDAELRFQKALTCNTNDEWRVEKNYTDIYFCRRGYPDFAQESEEKKIYFNEKNGSVNLLKVQQSDMGMYALYTDKNCTCVELVVKPDEKSCQPSDEKFRDIMTPPPNNNGTANNPVIIGSVLCGIIGGVVVVILI